MKAWEEQTNEELCLEYQSTNDEALFEYFLERNWRLGMEFALKYIQLFPQYQEDFEQGIRVAMWRCIKKFDIIHEVKFSTLFYYYVRSECQAVIRSRHSIRLPRGVWQKLKELEEEHPERVYSLMSLDFDYNKGGDADEEATLADIIADTGPSPEELCIKSQVEAKLIDIMDKYLKPSEAVAIKKYYGLDGHKPHTLEQIGHDYGLTRERIRQLICKGLNKLRARRKLIDG